MLRFVSGPIYLLIGLIAGYVEPDTGADANVMDEYQFKSLLQQVPEFKETELRKTKMKLKILTEELPVMGECSVTMENETRKAEATIAVIKGKIDSYPLLARKTLEDLGMVHLMRRAD